MIGPLHLFFQAKYISFSFFKNLSIQSIVEMAKKFFKDFIYRPFDNWKVLAVVALIVLGGIGGLLFLIKKVYDKYCAQKMSC
jgi:hypothetical protein